MTTCAVLLSGGLDSAVLLAEEAARGAVQPIYMSASGSPGNRPSARWWTRCSRAVRCAAARADSSRCPWTCATSTRLRTGPSPARRRPITRPTKTCTCRAATSSCWQGRRVLRRGRHRSPRARHARPQSVSRRDAGIPGGHGAARCRWGWRTTSRLTRRTRRSSKAEVIRRGAALGVPFELTLSCMSPAFGVGRTAAAAALRDVQQVPGAARRVRGRRHRGSDRVRDRAIYEWAGLKAWTSLTPRSRLTPQRDRAIAGPHAQRTAARTYSTADGVPHHSARAGDADPVQVDAAVARAARRDRR